MRHALRVGREARVGGKLRQPDALAELGEQPVVRRGDHQLAVCRPEHLVRSDQREGRAERPGALPLLRVAVSW